MDEQFQSTLPQGERQGTIQQGNKKLNISIHAPTRGATLSPDNELTKFSYFNPRSHKGSDKDIPYQIQTSLISIHAPTRGATYSANSPMPESINFNPRSHKGSDINIAYPIRCRIYFNPRSHKGSDQPQISYTLHQGDFNPRSHKGSDSNFPQF